MVLGSRSGTGKMFLIVAIVLLLTFLLNIIADFCKLGTWTDGLQNSWRIVRMVVASCSVACPHSMRSFAKRREWIGGQPGPRETPVRLEVCNLCCKRMESSLMATTKR